MTESNAAPCRAPRIVRVQAHEVVVPARAGSVNSECFDDAPGESWDRQPICLVEVTTDDGLTGLGEAGRGITLAELAPDLKRLVGMELAGATLRDLPDDWRDRPYPGLIDRHPRRSWPPPRPVGVALEAALLDLAGKRLGCRAVDILGGACRRRVPVAFWTGRQRPEDLARLTERALSMGFTAMKTKSKLGDPAAEQLQAVRGVAGDGFSLTIDAMFRWFEPAEAMPVFRRLERIGGAIQVEDPFPQDLPDHWRRVRSVCPVPMIWHARSMDVLRRGLQENCCDGFNACGGLWGLITQGHAIEIAGYSCWAGSSMELGVRQAALLHAAAACRPCVMPSDFASALVREHTLVDWDWPYRDGALPLPDGPGLGVSLDRAALRRYTTSRKTFS